MQKKIMHILSGRPKQITKEETVLQPLPHKDFRFANPFIVLHHLIPRTIEPGTESRIHPHPHRGFAPFTFQLQGQGFHKDNAGHSETINPGDVQYMFAGKGILHSEGPSAQQHEKGGVYELIQLWVNVPAKNKWDQPSYQTANKAMQPAVSSQPGVHLRLISGNYEDKAGPVQMYTPVISIIGEIEKGKQVQLAARPGYWTLLYIAHGSIQLNCETIEAKHLIVFEKENEEIIFSTGADTQLLFLSAQPVDEPVAAKDNFVMNTKEEIDQALQDAASGAFGTLDY